MRSFKGLIVGDKVKFSYRAPTGCSSRSTFIDEGEGELVGFDYADYAKRERGADVFKLKPHYALLKCDDGQTYKFTPGQLVGPA